MKKLISFLCLLLCTFIWGTTFVAQDSGMDHIGPFTFNSVRFFVGFIAISPLVIFLERKKIKLEINSKKQMFFELSLKV